MVGKPKNEVVNWEDPTLQRWLNTITNKGTKKNYKTAFRAYTSFTGMTASQLIDEAIADMKRDPRERKDVVLTKLIRFYHWVVEEYTFMKKGVVHKGASETYACAWNGCIRSFYATFDITVRMKGRHRLPKPRVKNKRMKINGEQVKVLVDHARTPRDRAIILTNFQGGLDASTLCSLNYGDVSEGLAKNEHPLKLEVHRPKSGVDFYTFLGRDAIKALEAYLADLKSRGVTLRGNMPLFVQERGKARMKPENIQTMMRTVAIKAGFIDEENNGFDFNPLGPHALRESMSGLMTNSGVPDTIVDFWLGHEIGSQAEAYKGPQFESVRTMYLEREKLLSIETPKLDLDKLKAKLRVEVEEQNRQLRGLMDHLLLENVALKKKIELLEATTIRQGDTVELKESKNPGQYMIKVHTEMHCEVEENPEKSYMPKLREKLRRDEEARRKKQST